MARIKINTINHVGLPISDRAGAMKMYRDVMGLGVIPHQVEGNTLAWTEFEDGSMLHLIDPPAAGRGDGRQHVAFEVDDLDVVIKALEEAGVALSGKPDVRADGQRHLFVHDPDGNRIEICTRGDHAETARTVDENGYTAAG